jgi:hypothetical protein
MDKVGIGSYRSFSMSWISPVRLVGDQPRNLLWETPQVSHLSGLSVGVLN